MNQDNKLNNLLSNLRKENGFTQKQLAIELNTNINTISKWENGFKKPYSNLFSVSIDTLSNIIDKNITPNIKKIVLTGGACSGKTTALDYIKKHFEKLGYTIIIIKETATELMNSGITPITCTKRDFQNCVLNMQLMKEKIIEKTAKKMNKQKILIVCDRGTMDCKGYISKKDFKYIINSINLTELQLKRKYDAVFHLVTAAKGFQNFYTKDNNSARYESIQEATLSDSNIISAWNGHHYFKIIGNTVNFDDKMKTLLKEISIFLNEPYTY